MPDRASRLLAVGRSPVEVEVEDKTGDLEADLYWSMTNHNKALLGIDTDVEDYWLYPRP